LLKAGLQQYQLGQDDRSLLPSARREVGTRSRGLSDVSPRTERPSLGLGIQLPTIASKTNSISSPSQPDANVPIGTPVHTYQNGVPSNSVSSPPQPEATIAVAKPNESTQSGMQEPPSCQAEVRTDNPTESHFDDVVPAPLKLVAPKDKTATKEDDKQLIKKEEVSKQINAIDEFLAKRVRSRKSFRDELNRLSMISTNISPISPHPSFTVSPVLQSTSAYTDSPIGNSRPTSTLLFTIMETLDGQGPPVPPKDDPWNSPSPMEGEDSAKMLIDEQDEPRKDSETLGHGMPTILPDTPPDSLGRQSATDDWGALGIPLAGTLKVPGFGEGVEDGLEVVGQKLVSDPGLIPANENHDDVKDLTPATSVQSIDYAMRHDSSFFKYGGFCDGAKMSLRGAGGTMKELTKPGVRNFFVFLKIRMC
jgi:hypothetical protein